MTNPPCLQGHLLNPPASGWPGYLYRIVPLNRFLDGLRMGVNTLVSPANWEDPYEAAQLRVELEHPLFVDGAGVYSSGLRDDVPRKVQGSWKQSSQVVKRIFCQCWSNLAESDAMWRLYSPENEGVKLRIPLQSLLESLARSGCGGTAFLGPMEYLAQPAFDDLIADCRKNWLIQVRPDLHPAPALSDWARSVLRKRSQFAHESEYRLVLCGVDSNKQYGNALLFEYPVDWKSLVCEVELDPRCGNPSDVMGRIANAGYDGEIKVSPLYKPPQKIFRPWWPEDTGWKVRGRSVSSDSDELE